MSSEIEDNPCCRKKGTLVITIEPCTKGKETKPDKQEFYRADKYVPGLPYKTPRTMEIEVKIKGKDQEFFSEEELLPQHSSEEFMEETELITHSPLKELDKDEESEEDSRPSKKSTDSDEPVRLCSARTISLEKKPCSNTCPGILICRPKKHFFGDNCKLHDPTPIGNQILEMHKNGSIQKRLYTNERIYPDHILSAVSEIKKRQEGEHTDEAKATVSGDKGDAIEEKVVRKKATSLGEVKPEASKEESKTASSNRPSKDEQAKRNRSGCFC